jgi:hypothetical protein
MINTVLSVVQCFVAAAFLVAGATKLLKDRTILLSDPRMAWANDFSASQIRLIALAEVLAAAGLIVPLAIGVLPVTALAATVLALLMAGAAFTHLRRRETAVTALVLGLLSAAVAIGRTLLT